MGVLCNTHHPQYDRGLFGLCAACHNTKSTAGGYPARGARAAGTTAKRIDLTGTGGAHAAAFGFRHREHCDPHHRARLDDTTTDAGDTKGTGATAQVWLVSFKKTPLRGVFFVRIPILN